MPRFLFMTDSHFRDDKPRNRIDDIIKSQFDELKEIAELCREKKVDYILHGGDFFHTRKPSHHLVGRLIDWSKNLSAGVFSVIGNHDILGYNLDSVNNSGLGVLFECDAVKRLDYEKFESDKIVIKGVHSTLHFENNYMFDEKYYKYTKIAISHNYIIPQDDMPFEFIHPKDINTNADLVLCGHYHTPFDYTHNNTRWINPGSLSRWSLNERDHRPSVIIFDADSKGIKNLKHVELQSPKLGNEIFDEEAIKTEKKQDYDMDKFVSTLQSTSFDKIDIEDVAKKAGKEQNVGQEVMDIVVENIRKAKEVLR